MEQLDANLAVTDIYAREIIDAAGNPAVETEVLAGDGIVARASVSLGTSDQSRTEKAVEDINRCIAQELIGKNVFAQEEIDKLLTDLDGSADLGVLGREVLFTVSAAVAGAASAVFKIPLYRYLGGVHTKCMPVPAVSVMGTGMRRDTREGMGEYMVVPFGGASFRQQMKICTDIYHCLRQRLRRGGTEHPGVKDGDAPLFSCAGTALSLIRDAVELAGYQLGREAGIALDGGGLYRYDPGGQCYHIRGETSGQGETAVRSASEMCGYYEELVGQYAVCSIEDPLDQEDWEGWIQLTGRLGKRVQLVGNKLFASDRDKLERGIRLGAANAVLIRPDQAGTLTGTADLIKRAQEAGYRVVLEPHETGTADAVSSDLAVAFHVGQIKAGALCHMEYVEKYNRLLRISEKLGETG